MPAALPGTASIPFMYGCRRFLYWTPFGPANQHEADLVGRER
jgi:hypothetical protein